MNELAKKLARHFLRKDPEIEARISEGIESNRKGFGGIKLIDAKGDPIKKASIKLSLKQHEYHFGCNLFMLDEFPDGEQNAAYREIFKEVFNLGVIPFYWCDLEPEDGYLRFDKSSPKIYRRPPPDLCLEYCRENGLIPKGHPLLWHRFFPEWLRHSSKQDVALRIARRFREIADRYAGSIRNWDVVNEAQSWYPPECPLPDAHVDFAFKLAERHFPGCALNYNDDNKWWQMRGDYGSVYLLAKHLIERGSALNAIGFQYHMFEGLLGQADQFMNPRHLFLCLDHYAKLNLPINLSEISIIARRDLGDGDEFQAVVTEALYRLWFSHPATNGAVWWNLVDGTGAYAPIGSEQGENSLRAGLLNYDFTPKKAFTVLKHLIKEEWNTCTEVAYEEGNTNTFRGFYGTYDVRIESASKTLSTQIKLAKGAPNQFAIIL